MIIAFERFDLAFIKLCLVRKLNKYLKKFKIADNEFHFSLKIFYEE